MVFDLDIEERLHKLAFRNIIEAIEKQYLVAIAKIKLLTQTLIQLYLNNTGD